MQLRSSVFAHFVYSSDKFIEDNFDSFGREKKDSIMILFLLSTKCTNVDPNITGETKLIKIDTLAPEMHVNDIILMTSQASKM